MWGAAGMEIRPIGVIRTPFADKFGIPRQPGLIPEVEGVIELAGWVGGPEVVRGLEGFSHIWVLWAFHQAKDVKRVVRPPRLKGRGRVGVFASRSPHRPNRIGMSVLPLREIRTDRGVRLRVGGADMVDGTPILDIKPYLAFTDAIPEARAGWAQEPIERLPVSISPDIRVSMEGRPELPGLIEGVLSLDPRPNSHHRREKPEYVMRLGGADVRWRVGAEGAEVLGVELAPALLKGLAPEETGDVDGEDGDGGDAG